MTLSYRLIIHHFQCQQRCHHHQLTRRLSQVLLLSHAQLHQSRYNTLREPLRSCFSTSGTKSSTRRKGSWPTAKQRMSDTVHHGYRIVDRFAWMKTPMLTEDARSYIDQEMRLTAAMQEKNRPFQTRIKRRLEELEMDNKAADMPTVIDGTVYFRRWCGTSWCYYRRRDCSGTRKNHTEQLLDTATLTEMYGRPVVISSMKIAPSQDYMAVIVETTAMDSYNAHILRIGNDSTDFVDMLGDVLSIEFSDHGVVYYTKMQGLRVAQVWCHHIGQDSTLDDLVLDEPDKKYFFDLSHTKDRAYITINVNSVASSEVYLIDSRIKGIKAPNLVCPRKDGVHYVVEHREGLLYVLTNAEKGGEYRLVSFPVGVCPPSIDSLTSADSLTVFAPEKDWHIVDMDVFSDHCVMWMMEGTTPRIIVLQGDASQQASIVEVPGKFCQMTPGPNSDFSGLTSGDHQFALASPVHPTTIFSLEIKDDDPPRVVPSQSNCSVPNDRFRDSRRNGESSGAVCTRLVATSDDGTLVPVTVFHKDKLNVNGRLNPMLVCAYGAYGIPLDMSYSQHAALLVERGWVVAYCHVRGGSDLGIQWHHSGRAANKVKSFEAGYSKSSLTAVHGVSAGGLLAAALCNRAPHLIQAAILEVPYVDMLSTMLDPDLPLTQQEMEEWGDPINDPAAFDLIMSYCPYQNLTNQKYPAMFVTTSISDTRVPYWVPLRYVAKLRHMMSSSSCRSHIPLYLHVLEEGGHFGQFAESDANDQIAVQTTFLYGAMGLSME